MTNIITKGHFLKHPPNRINPNNYKLSARQKQKQGASNSTPWRSDPHLDPSRLTPQYYDSYYLPSLYSLPSDRSTSTISNKSSVSSNSSDTFPTSKGAPLTHPFTSRAEFEKKYTSLKYRGGRQITAFNNNQILHTSPIKLPHISKKWKILLTNI